MPLYNRGLAELFSAVVDWDGATDLRILLLNTSASFNADHNFVSDIVANEISVSGYARQSLAGRTVTESDAADRAIIDASDTAFGALASGQTIGAAVIYRHVGGDDAANPLFAYLNLTDTPTNGGTFTLQWDATNGLFYGDNA